MLLDWGLNTEDAGLVSVCRLIVAVLHSNYRNRLLVSFSKGLRIVVSGFLARRVGLHSALRRLATTKDGPGPPVEILLRFELVQYDADNEWITLVDSSVDHYTKEGESMYSERAGLIALVSPNATINNQQGLSDSRGSQNIPHLVYQLLQHEPQ